MTAKHQPARAPLSRASRPGASIQRSWSDPFRIGANVALAIILGLAVGHVLASGLTFIPIN